MQIQIFVTLFEYIDTVNDIYEYKCRIQAHILPNVILIYANVLVRAFPRCSTVLSYARRVSTGPQGSRRATRSSGHERSPSRVRPLRVRALAARVRRSRAAAPPVATRRRSAARPTSYSTRPTRSPTLASSASSRTSKPRVLPNTLTSSLTSAPPPPALSTAVRVSRVTLLEIFKII